MTFETLIVARDGAVAVVTINRPSVLNALNAQTIDDLRRALLELRRDEDVRAVVVTGAGEKAFVAAGLALGWLMLLFPIGS
jgi:enoyl-CoA hydratase